jgi:biopolymer transport protein ExbD
MRKRFTRRHQRSSGLPELMLTPLIDTFATLLIIFIVATPMVKNGIQVSLPQGKTKEAGQTQDLVVTMSKDGKLYFNSFPVKRSNLVTVVQKALTQKEDLPVYVRADEGLEYGKVIEIVDVLKQAGVHYVAMSTRPS